MTRVGYAARAYDLFHVGHLNILRRARSHCDYLIAGVVSDEMLTATKGKPPVVPLAERMEIVEAIRWVDQVHAETIPDKHRPDRGLRERHGLRRRRVQRGAATGGECRVAGGVPAVPGGVRRRVRRPDLVLEPGSERPGLLPGRVAVRFATLRRR